MVSVFKSSRKEFKLLFRSIFMVFDLHTHTTASDGKLSSRELIDMSIMNGLEGIAITDHDSVSGISEAIKYSKGKNIEVVPGIEISCDCEGRTKDVHIVGMFIDYKNPEFGKISEQAKKNRKITAVKILDNLKDFGFDIPIEDLEKQNHFARPYIAELLMEKYPKDFPNWDFVFDEYLGSRGKIKVAPVAPEMKYAIDVIHSTNGIAILAHPGYFRDNDNYFIDKFIRLGGDGIETETIYSSFDNPERLREKYRKIAKENNLLISGGSDFHYKKEGKNVGCAGISKKEFLKLKEFIL